MNFPCTNTLEIFLSSPQNKNRSSIPSSCFSLPPTGDPTPQRPGLPALLRTSTNRASKLLPGLNDPICFSRQQTSAPPMVARYSSVGIDNWRLANFVADGPGVFKDTFDCIATTFAAILALCMAWRIDVENPPDTSVPRPTYIIELACIFCCKKSVLTLIPRSRYSPMGATPLLRLKLLVGQ